MNHANVDRIMTLVPNLHDEQGITLVLVAHNIRAVMNVCASIGVLLFGRNIAEGAPQYVAQNRLMIQAYLGVSDDDDAA